ncbi:MAG: outer membrane beta-barrel protein [Methylocystis sp.]
MKKTLSALALCAALASGAAQAADLPSRKGAPVYVPPPAPMFTWTGLYAGLNLGGGWGDSHHGGQGSVLGGGQIGYNLQLSPLFVAGLETDFQGSSSRNLNWFGTVRGRLGVTPFSPNLLIYGTGGFAYGEGSGSNNGWNPAWATAFAPAPAGGFPPVGFNGGNGSGGARTGWTAGGGVEWAFRPNISVKVEYLYTDLSGGGDNGWWGARQHHNQSNLVRAGVNYHFNVAAPAPMFAKF